MKQALEHYFITYGHLELPSLGSLKLVKTDAAVNEEHIWTTPSYTIKFENIEVVNNKHLIIYLAENLNISTEQTAVQLESFINEIKLSAEEPFLFGSLGFFKKINTVLEFHSIFNSNTYFETISYQPVSNNEYTETTITEKKSNWILWSCIIFIISIIAIVYKFYA